jgi:hypothetical protein
MTKETLLYTLAMRLVAVLAFEEYLDLEHNIEVRGEEIEGAVRLVALELEKTWSEVERRIKDAEDNRQQLEVKAVVPEFVALPGWQNGIGNE